MMRAALVITCVILFAAPSPAAGQKTANQRCDVNGTGRNQIKLASGEYDTYWGGPATARCPSKKIIIKADSIEQHVDDKRIYLLGHVYYEEPRFNVHSDFLTYFQAEERIVAIGNVDAKMSNGSTLKGPNATYLRPMEHRPLQKLTATARPTITLVDHDSAGKPTPPVTLIATTVVMEGDSLVYASGLVNMVRQDFTATGDSMFLDGNRETMHILRDPVIRGEKGRKFTLTGILIDLFSKNKKLRRVVSKGKAVAVSQDLTLASDTIDLRVNEDVLERAMAWGPKRATAKSPTQNLLADSIDVLMPGQRVREIRAVRKAYAEAKPDSVRFRADSGDMDWLRGSTIIAYFDTVPPRDTTQSARIRQMVAIDTAAAYYHRPPSDSTCRKPIIVYTTGKRITANFNEQGMDSVIVQTADQGVTAEPICAKTDSAAAKLKADSIAAKPKKPPPPASHVRPDADSPAAADHRPPMLPRP
jgi:hypothetical protein